MKITFVTLFEDIVSQYFSHSIMGRALKNNLFQLSFVNPRDFSKDKHKKVDSYMIGGGAGMLMSPQPLFDAIKYVKTLNIDSYFIVPTPSGKPFRQNDAKRLAKKENLVFLCGRYEGMDERIIEKFANEVFSVGDFVVSGGELPSMSMSDSILRNIQGVLGNQKSLEIESFENGLIEAPSFTKPKIFENINVPSEFLKGNHSKIADLKNVLSCQKTKFYRPELYKKQKIVL